MRILVIQCGADAVLKYRFGNAIRGLGTDITVLNLNKEMESLSDAETAKLRRVAKNYRVNEFEWFLHKWFLEHGMDWDVVWTNDHREELAISASHLKERGARVIVDIDDHFEEIPTGNPSMRAWNQRKKRVYRLLLEIADNVSVSSEFLRKTHGGTLNPNFVWPDEWQGSVRKTKKAEECVICCPAGSGRAEDYLQLSEQFRRVADVEGVKFLFIGWMPDWALEYPAGKVVYSRWFPLDMYQKAMRWISPDIIVSPMMHNNFNLAKSNLKWLESGAIEACFVGERWGEYERTVEDGVTGVLAFDPKEWEEKLMWLIKDPEARHKIARAGSEAVCSEWTWDGVGESWRRTVLGDYNDAIDSRLVCSDGHRSLATAAG